MNELDDGRIDLSGRVAIVTGGSRGIGLAVAQAFVRSGAAVALAARKHETLDQALESFASDERDRVLPVATHAADREQAARCVDAATERFGPVTILVNNAATSPYFGPLVGLDDTRAAKMVALNQFGPLMWAQLVWDRSMREHGGSIVNVSSMGSGRVETGFAYYNVTKAALEHLTRSLAAELAPHVRVNAVAPGVIRTDLSRALWAENEADVAGAIPMARLGEPADVARAVRFLVSAEAAWITGVTLLVDGGSMVAPRSLG